jgi:large subunit ribosomal protein L9
MKIILLQNVPKIGQKGDVKDLKEGYVRNMLLPRGLAKIATTGELNSLKAQAESVAKYQNAEVSRIADLFKKLDGQIIELSEKTNDKGHLFAKVGKDEVISAISSQCKVKLEPEWFELDPIKEVGDYSIDLKFEKIHKTFILKIVNN